MICADPDDPKDYKQSFQERTHHCNENIVFGHFFGVRGAAQGGSMAQNMPLGPLETGEHKYLLVHNF